MKLTQILKRYSHFDWWQDEQDIYSHNQQEEDTLSIIRQDNIHEVPFNLDNWNKWDFKRQEKIKEEFKDFKLYFIDGKINILFKLLFNFKDIFFSQIAAGYITYFKNKLKIEKSPLIKNYIILPYELANSTNYENPFNINFKNRDIKFFISISDNINSYQHILTLMRNLEYTMQKNLIKEESSKKSIIIKDGILTSEYPILSIQSNKIGPIGFAKRIIKEKLPPELLKLALSMKKYQRTPYFASKIHTSADKIRLSTYIKLIDTSNTDHPYMGITRLEVFTDLKYDKNFITKLFDFLALKIPDLTTKGPIPRLPENILPIYSLEQYINNYFLNKEVFKSIYIRWKEM